MPRVSFAFFTLAALSGIIGTYWGHYMGMTGDHSTFTGHAHLNLLGWVGMAVMGTFYALAAGRYPPWLAWMNFALQAVGAASLPVAMVYVMARSDESFVPLAIIGTLAAFFSMVVFLITVLVAWRRAARIVS